MVIETAIPPAILVSVDMPSVSSSIVVPQHLSTMDIHVLQQHCYNGLRRHVGPIYACYSIVLLAEITDDSSQLLTNVIGCALEVKQSLSMLTAAMLALRTK